MSISKFTTKWKFEVDSLAPKIKIEVRALRWDYGKLKSGYSRWDQISQTRKKVVNAS